jgi:sortase A
MRTRVLRGVAACGVVLVAAGSAVTFEGREAPHRFPAAVRGARLAAGVPAPATTALPTTALPTTALPPSVLPVPDPVPANPDEDVAVVAIGSIEIPRVGVSEPLHEGVWQTVIDRGPAHWPGTAMPGGWGNVVVAGHRTTHTRPFLDLDLLDPGDEIVLRTDRAYTYRVTSSTVVDANETWIVDQHPGRTVTLFTCHPKGSEQHRLVVFGELVGS